MQILQESTCVGVFFNKVTGPQNCNFIKKRLQHRFLPVKFANFFKNTLFYRTSPVAASASFRFRARLSFKKETPAKMIFCEFCKIFKNIFFFDRKKWLDDWMIASCVYLWNLRSFSEHFFYKVPMGNCLFHVQVTYF